MYSPQPSPKADPYAGRYVHNLARDGAQHRQPAGKSPRTGRARRALITKHGMGKVPR